MALSIGLGIKALDGFPGFTTVSANTIPTLILSQQITASPNLKAIYTSSTTKKTTMWLLRGSSNTIISAYPLRYCLDQQQSIFLTFRRSFAVMNPWLRQTNTNSILGYYILQK